MTDSRYHCDDCTWNYELGHFVKTYARHPQRADFPTWEAYAGAKSDYIAEVDERHFQAGGLLERIEGQGEGS